MQDRWETTSTGDSRDGTGRLHAGSAALCGSAMRQQQDQHQTRKRAGESDRHIKKTTCLSSYRVIEVVELMLLILHSQVTTTMTSQQHHKNLERSITSEMIVQKYRNQMSYLDLYLVVALWSYRHCN